CRRQESEGAGGLWLHRGGGSGQGLAGGGRQDADRRIVAETAHRFLGERLGATDQEQAERRDQDKPGWQRRWQHLTLRFGQTVAYCSVLQPCRQAAGRTSTVPGS